MTLTHHLGYWSALASTVAGAVYLLAIVYALVTGQMVVPPGATVMIQPDWLHVVGAAVTFACAATYVVLVASIHDVTPARMQRSASLALRLR